MCVVKDFPFWIFLALVAAFRIAGATERSSRGVDEVGFLAGALAAGACASVWTLNAVFVLAAGLLGLAAVVSVVRPVEDASLRTAARRMDAGRLHLLRGGRAFARSV